MVHGEYDFQFVPCVRVASPHAPAGAGSNLVCCNTTCTRVQEIRSIGVKKQEAQESRSKEAGAHHILCEHPQTHSSRMVTHGENLRWALTCFCMHALVEYMLFDR